MSEGSSPCLDPTTSCLEIRPLLRLTSEKKEIQSLMSPATEWDHVVYVYAQLGTVVPLLPQGYKTFFFDVDESGLEA